MRYASSKQNQPIPTGPEPRKGDRRVCTAFLWLPMAIRGEARWLRHVMWIEEWAVMEDLNGIIYRFWRRIAWIDEDKPGGGVVDRLLFAQLYALTARP